MDNEAKTQDHFRISSLKAFERNVRDDSNTVLNSMFCLNCGCVLIKSLHRGRFCLRSAGFSSFYREYRYIEDRYIEVLSHTFHCNFCRDLEYSSLYREYRYIGVRLYHINLWSRPHTSSRSSFCWLKRLAMDIINPLSILTFISCTKAFAYLCKM